MKRNRRHALVASGCPFGSPLLATSSFGHALPSTAAVQTANVRLHLTETIAMLILGPLLTLAGISVLCSLVFTLAVFALPFRHHYSRRMGLSRLGRCIQQHPCWFRCRWRNLRHRPIRSGPDPVDMVAVTDHPHLRRAGRCRRLQRLARNRPSLDAVPYLADDFLRCRRHRDQLHGIRSFHRNDRARTDKAGQATTLTLTVLNVGTNPDYMAQTSQNHIVSGHIDRADAIRTQRSCFRPIAIPYGSQPWPRRYPTRPT